MRQVHNNIVPSMSVSEGGKTLNEKLQFLVVFYYSDDPEIMIRERRSDCVDRRQTKTFQFPEKQQILCPQEFRGICLKTRRRHTSPYILLLHIL